MIYPNNHNITKSYDLARNIDASYSRNTSLKRYAYHYKDVRGLAVLRGTKMPAVIVECGFMRNTESMRFVVCQLFSLRKCAEEPKNIVYREDGELLKKVLMKEQTLSFLIVLNFSTWYHLNSMSQNLIMHLESFLRMLKIENDTIQSFTHDCTSVSLVTNTGYEYIIPTRFMLVVLSAVALNMLQYMVAFIIDKKNTKAKKIIQSESFVAELPKQKLKYIFCVTNMIVTLFFLPFAISIENQLVTIFNNLQQASLGIESYTRHNYSISFITNNHQNYMVSVKAPQITIFIFGIEIVVAIVVASIDAVKKKRCKNISK